MNCFLFLINLCLSRGISLAVYGVYDVNKSEINSNETTQRRDPFATVNGLRSANYSQNSTEETTLQPIYTDYVAAFKSPSPTYWKHLLQLTSKEYLFSNLFSNFSSKKKADNMTVQKIKRSLPEEISFESLLLKMFLALPMFKDPLNKHRMITILRIGSSSSSFINTDIYEDDLDNIKFVVFELYFPDNGTFNVVPRQKAQTAQEITTEFFGHLKRKYFTNTSKIENECCSKSFVNHSNPYLCQLCNLKKAFDCQISKNGKLKIVCNNISLYNISEYIPSETEALDISESIEPFLAEPLFPHLKNLTSLRLCYNHHIYIFKAFEGLRSLIHLDLSANNIESFTEDVFAFTPNLKSLNLSRNSIILLSSITTAVSHLKYFENLTLDHNINIETILKSDIQSLKGTRLKSFSLINSSLENIENGAFTRLFFLNVLDLSVSYMNNEALSNVTSGLEYLSIKYFGVQSLVNLNNFPKESLVSLRDSFIYRLDLSTNYFPEITEFPYIPSLRSLWLTRCSIEIIETGAFAKLLDLVELDLSKNKLFMHPLGTTVLKDLELFYVSNQVFANGIRYYLPYFAFQNTFNLVVLDMSNIVIASHISRYNFYRLSNLKTLHLSNTELLGIEDYAFETLISLTLLDLTGNSLTYITNVTFYGLESLTQLYLSRNLLKFSQPVNPFQYMPFLKTLYLHDNKIETFPQKIFAELNYLEILIISTNNILPWSTEMLPTNHSLNVLGLSENQINFITPVMLTEFRQVSKYLDLRRNPFNCSICGMDDFQNFLKSSNLTLGLPPPNKMENSLPLCAEPVALRDQSFIEVELGLLACVDTEIEVLSLTSLILLIVAMLFITIMLYLCYFFRWYVRYWIFHVRAKFIENTTLDKGKVKRYTYDAFVSYNSQDTNWIVRHLIPALEREDPRYKLCLHDRDFEIGRLIIENILEAIEASRNIILVLSESFIKSEWCMFELHMAQHRLFDNTRDCLILIKLKKLDKKLYSRNLMYLEKTRTCLTWTEDKADQKLFWERMRKILGAPSSASISAEVCV
ncbi:toll-like receptor 2 [Caerostris darwini]|uniref:Toll-like receptor 2 n=1 Tax=Caerostris darwini TaxID=1538125 RepID=A0AAV4RAG3_9ARAC|nr:toll-like receptor 2 [Caerostris darwini]